MIKIKTKRRTTRINPASDVAPTLGDAKSKGLRRYLARACVECHHRIKILLPDHPQGTCERCLIVGTLDNEDSTADQRKYVRNLMEATQRGPAAYVVDPFALSRQRQSEEGAWQTEFAKIKERAQGAVGLFLALLEDEPELLRRACLWAPGTSHPWSRSTITLIQDVHMFADLGSYLGHLADAVDAHLAGDPLATSTIRFLLGIEWKSEWITPREFEDARSRAAVTERNVQTWKKTNVGTSDRGDKWFFEKTTPADEDHDLWARWQREQQERAEMSDKVYRSDLRRWERGIDTLDRDSNDYRLALHMKPKAPDGFYGRIEAKKRAKNRDAEIAAIIRRAEKRRAASAARDNQTTTTN